MKYEIPSKTLTLWRIRAAALAVLLMLTSIMLTDNALILFVISSIIFIVFGFTALVYLPGLFKNYSCEIIGSHIILKTGVFIKRVHIFPLTRLIYTQVYRTPLSVKMELTAIGLKAARNRVYIPEMLDTDASALLSFLAEDEKNEA